MHAISCLFHNNPDMHKVIIIGVLICISLFISSVEHHFMYLLAICVSSLGKKNLFKFSACFLTRLLFFY